MRELLEQVPTAFWVVGLICYLAGIATAWRFARYVERIRDKIEHAWHHWARVKDFAHRATMDAAGFAVSGAVFMVIVGGVGFLAWLRFTG